MSLTRRRRSIGMLVACALLASAVPAAGSDTEDPLGADITLTEWQIGGIASDPEDGLAPDVALTEWQLGETAVDPEP